MTLCQGSAWVCLSPREMRWRSRSMSRIFARTFWPMASTSEGWLTWLQDNSEMWIRPSMPSRSTKAPKSTMLEMTPSTTWPGCSSSRIFCRISRRSSSSTARRDRTTLLRLRLSSMTLHSSLRPMNSSRSWTRRMSTSEAGRKPRTPRSRMRPPLTTSMTLPMTGSPDSAAASLGVHLREHERVDLLADRDLVRRIDGPANRQLRDRDDALRLVADVDENLVLVDAHDRAMDDLALVDLGEGGLVVRDEFPVRACRPDTFFCGSVLFGDVVRHRIAEYSRMQPN